MLAVSETVSAWAPTLLMLGLALAVIPLLDRFNGWHRAVLAAVAVFLSLRYIHWRATDTLAPAGFTFDALASWSFFLVEAVAMVSSISAFVLLSRHRNRSPDADANAGWWGENRPTVAVLIATYNEEWPILERTIAGAKALRWQEKTIYVLDDGRREWLGERCAELGVVHVTRDSNAHGKAGNINNALDRLRASGQPPDFVAVLDADFVPHLGFISRSLSLFKDETIGLVQTPQHFFNADPIQHNLGISRAYPDEQRFFFDHLQPARDAWGIPVCCGTSSIVRWTALDAIGGFPTDSVTEDYLLTVRLQDNGYSTAYLNEPLSEGLAPEGLKEYITQRARWGMGFMQIVRGPYGPFKANRLRLRDRWGLIDSFLYWASIFPFKIACIIYPLFYWYFGIIVVDTDFDAIVANFGPYYIMTMAFMNFASKGLFVPLVHDVSQLVGARDITRGVFTGLFRPHGQKFKVTMKGGDRTKATVQWPILRGFLILFGLTIGGLLIGLVYEPAFDGLAGDGKLVILFWTLYNLVSLALTILVCVELPRTASLLRRDPERVFVASSGRRLEVWLADINQDAARLRGVTLPVNAPASVEMAGIGLMRGTVAQSIGGTVDIALELTEEQRQDLYEKLHTREGEPGTGFVATADLLSGVARRIFSTARPG
ncbi:cellulose synthase catalytic subunit [Pelagibacterium flavum]|uniref:Cellulose synthase catalytic subunit n=1 Tax=Pelagibacterium flavum TaxID=2984530 RepID=A0ABY6IXE1_9HYPH|nr:cellulose synthase catalytic subunit [Pelagibacterium sp. YIM 151497]UYQ74064.1 cellulose synthase catalytic subunit [Pelagibacterium sp. YIM 151497]|tara:strand:- start:2550 stop:4523 length:1974 start_codon:yes stop_codon:yes gene_type:complete